jgi:lysyl-tRNA synthetase class II
MSEQQKSLQQIMDFRLEKLQKLKDAGVNPYPHQFKPTHSSQELRRMRNLTRKKPLSMISLLHV